MDADKASRYAHVWSVYVRYLEQSRKQAWQHLLQDPTGRAWAQCGSWPLPKHHLWGAPDAFYVSLCRYATPWHKCQAGVCPQVKCRRVTEEKHTCNEQCRPFARHDVLSQHIPHKCTNTCEWNEFGDYFICKQSGNAHQCNSEQCGFLITTEEHKVCPLTAKIYHLDLGEESINYHEGENTGISKSHNAQRVSAAAPLFEADRPLPAPENKPNANNILSSPLPTFTVPPKIRSVAHAFKILHRPKYVSSTEEQTREVQTLELSRLIKKSKRATAVVPTKKRQQRISKFARLKDTDDCGQHRKVYYEIIRQVFVDSNKRPQLLPAELGSFLTDVIDKLWKLIIRSPIYPRFTNRYRMKMHCIVLLHAMCTGFDPISDGECIVPLVPALRDIVPSLKLMCSLAKCTVGSFTDTAKAFRKLIAVCPKNELNVFSKQLPKVPDSGLFFDPNEPLEDGQVYV